MIRGHYVHNSHAQATARSMDQFQESLRKHGVNWDTRIEDASFLIVLATTDGIPDHLLSRTILLDASRPQLSNFVGKSHLLGAIEASRMFRWINQRSLEEGMGLYGQRRIANLIPSIVCHDMYNHADYGMLEDPTCEDLTHLTARYLEAAAKLELL